MKKLPLSVWLLIATWGLSFCFCILVIVLARIDIPDLFSEAVKTVFDTFATPLGAILGFVFSKSGGRARRNKSGATIASTHFSMIDLFAVFVSLFYCSIFNYFIGSFALHRINIKSAIEAFSQLRPYLAFLITGLIALYFGSANNKTD